MRTFPVLATLALVSCARAQNTHPPLADRFYFPSGLGFVAVPGSLNGVLYVANSNYDRRYDHGSVMAVSLDAVRDGNGNGLPVLGAPVASAGPAQFPALNLGAQAFTVIQTFAGRVGQYTLPDGRQRLFIPSQGEKNPLQIIDANADALTCLFTDPAASTNCLTNAPSLSANANTPSSAGVPAAPQPWDVAIASDGQAFVTHVYGADSPPGTQKNIESYLVTFNAEAPPRTIPDNSFLLLDNAGSWDVVPGRRYAYVSGIFPQPSTGSAPDVLVRMVDRSGSGLVVYPQLRGQFQALQARGIALSADEQRLYLVTRTPDALLVLHINGATSDAPSLLVERIVPLPSGPMEIRMLPRAGRGDLLAITCEGSGSLVFYDNDLGDLASEVPGVGLQPADLAVDIRPGNQARVYVSDEAGGRVAVVDVPDLNSPQTARLVAEVGQPQTCLIQPTDPSCK